MKKKALSLVELVIGLAITAIIAAIVLVQFSLLDRRRLETNARSLVADLRWVRQMATSRHCNYIIEFDTGNEEYVAYEDRDADGIPDADEEVKRRRLEVNLESVTDFAGNPQTQITFNFPSGQAQDRIITLRHSERQRPIRVFGQTGYVKLDPLVIL